MICVVSVVLVSSQMECSVCFEQFDSVVRRPKMLACGHSFCLPCLQRLTPKRCPLDNKPFQTPPTEMVDNFSLLHASNNVWCRQCKKDATLACVDEHPVCSRKRARDEEAVPLLESLQRAGAALGKFASSQTPEWAHDFGE
ncbi:E3 ubiquitin-protein ligase RNF166-like [Thrips palmi]|uniref:E3 ubiquitin-protein ligase RNF166-like n=1 Tax=Thrips palmi TaxID=161013 RepID=A0A6P8Z0M8_THRPL|nr:E3 ubiquitin-protein ligase RNF166-like [Thrips palmi]